MAQAGGVFHVFVEFTARLKAAYRNLRITPLGGKGSTTRVLGGQPPGWLDRRLLKGLKDGPLSPFQGNLTNFPLAS